MGEKITFFFGGGGGGGRRGELDCSIRDREQYIISVPMVH